MPHSVIDSVLLIACICATKINEIFTYLKLLSSLRDRNNWIYQDLLSAEFNCKYVMYIVRSQNCFPSIKLLFRRLYCSAHSGIECLVDGLHVGTVSRQKLRYQPPSRAPTTLGNCSSEMVCTRPIYFLRYVPAVRSIVQNSHGRGRIPFSRVP